MKSILSICFVVTLLSCSRKENEVKAIQKTCFLESSSATDGQSFSVTKYEYSRGGLLLKTIDSSNINSLYSSAYNIRVEKYIYDKNDYLTKSQVTYGFYSDDRKLVDAPSTSTSVYKYNTEGKLTAKEHSGVGNFLSEDLLIDTYKYENGQLIQATLRTSAEITVIDFRAGLPIAVTSTVTHPLFSPTFYKVNDQGFIESFHYNDGSRDWVRVRKYDGLGRLVSIITQVGNGRPDEYLLEYDDKKRPEMAVPGFKGFPAYSLYGKQINNVTKTISGGTTSQTINTLYEYNQDGFPVKAQASGSNLPTPVAYVYTYTTCE